MEEVLTALIGGLRKKTEALITSVSSGLSDATTELTGVNNNLDTIGTKISTLSTKVSSLKTSATSAVSYPIDDYVVDKISISKNFSSMTDVFEVNGSGSLVFLGFPLSKGTSSLSKYTRDKLRVKVFVDDFKFFLVCRDSTDTHTGGCFFTPHIGLEDNNLSASSQDYTVPGGYLNGESINLYGSNENFPELSSLSLGGVRLPVENEDASGSAGWQAAQRLVFSPLPLRFNNTLKVQCYNTSGFTFNLPIVYTLD